jgi:hypothetical protein
MKKFIVVLILSFLVFGNSFAIEFNWTGVFEKIEDKVNEFSGFDPITWEYKEKSVKKTLVYWEFRADYIVNNSNCNKSDFIKIKNKTKITYIESWTYTKNDFRKKCVEKNLKKWQYLEEELMYWVWPSFRWFKEFSPSWYYIWYTIGWYEYSAYRLINTSNWNIVFDIDWSPTFSSWTKDKKQFVYGWSPWMSSVIWLYITIKWKFPETKKILEDYILGWYLDSKYIYLKTSDNDNNVYYKVIDIKTLKVIYTWELWE